MPDIRHFTIEEANALIPRLEMLMADAQTGGAYLAGGDAGRARR